MEFIDKDRAETGNRVKAMADIALFSNGAFSMDGLRKLTPYHFNLVVERTNNYLKMKAKANGGDDDLIST